MRPLWVGALVALAVVPLGSQTPRPFTAWDMTRVEDVGEARFSPDGNVLVFERHLSAGASEDFGPGGIARGRLFVARRDRGWAVSPLLTPIAGSRYLLGHFSPDGTWASFRRRAAGTHVIGAVHTRTGDVIEFPDNVDYLAYQFPWISSTQLVVRLLPEGRLPQVVERFDERLSGLAGLWRQGRAGVHSTASALGSGRFRGQDDRRAAEPSLGILDLTTRRARPLAAGTFDRVSVSPAGRWLAAIHERAADVVGGRLDRSAGVQRELRVFDLQTGTSHTLCPGRNVSVFTAAGWSSDGARLTVSAIEADAKSDDDVRLWHVTPGTWDCRPAAPDTFRVVRGPTRNSGSVNVPRSAWLGSRFVVLGYPVSAGPEARGWYLVSEAQPPRLLTAAFGSDSIEVVGSTNTHLILIAGGQAWSVDVDGIRTRLAPGVTQPVRLWMDDITPGYPPLPTIVVPTMTVLPLETRPADVLAPRHVVQVELSSGRVTAPLEVPGPSKILSARPAASVLAFKTDVDGVRSLIVSNGTTREASQVLVTANTHLQSVTRARIVSVPHLGANGESLTSFLHLPAGAAPGQRLPTIVSIYPGTVYRTMRPASLTAMSSDHVDLWTSYGYAVLDASVPMSTQVPRDIGEGLSTKVVAAVDAAIATGWVDGDRLALQGHSFGGWGTLMTISQSHRFKAAVASAAPVNWVSMYGGFDPTLRMVSSAFGDLEVSLSEAESRSTGMGAPPWKDPDRYRRNSPLFHVETIRTPVMLVQGDLDYVPISEGEQMFTALQREGKNAVFVRYWGEWHGLASPANIRDFFARKLAWYDHLLDVRRTEGGDVVWGGDVVASRGGAAPAPHAWYLEVDRRRSTDAGSGAR